MGRLMPAECDRCGGIYDWGDFGPDPDDSSVGTTCSCPALRDDLALALRLLDAFMVNDDGTCARYGARTSCEGHEMWDLDPDGPCPGAEAHALLVRHGIRQAEGEPTACPDSSLLAWGLHEVNPDGRWEA